MGPFSKWFGSGSGSSDRGAVKDLERQLNDLEKACEKQDLGIQGSFLNRAGDLCLKAGDRMRALGYFGRAIDAFLEDQQPDLGRGVAMKIIRVHPQAVRTLCTLTWLDLASRQTAVALVHLRQYAEAAKRGHQQDLAAGQIALMAETIQDEEFTAAAAEALELLGQNHEANRIRELTAAVSADIDPNGAEELASRCLQAAVGSLARPKGDRALA